MSVNTAVSEDVSFIREPTEAHDPLEDSGLMALVAAAAILDTPCDAHQVSYTSGCPSQRLDELEILRSANRLGLKSGRVSIRHVNPATLPLPTILKKACQQDYRVLTGISECGAASILDPVSGEIFQVSSDEFLNLYDDQAILLSKKPASETCGQPFGIKWFIPVIVKHLAKFRLVVGASIIVQLFALVTPMLFQQIIDKVLVSRGLQSLDVLAIGLLGIAFYEPLFTYFRSLVFGHIASSVNSELSARLFSHIVNLPLSYFRSRKAGDIIARVRELDFIRSFLTGSALMLVLDLAFVFVFLGVMFSYSSVLSWWLLASLAVYFVCWLAIGPILRDRVQKQFERNADNTAFLTEAVTGIETLKSLGVRNRFSREWQDRLATQVKASFRAAMIENWAGGLISLVQKLTSVLILWFGVNQVLQGNLSVGELVAFNMLAGHVTMPILRLSQIWQDFQRVGISIQRVGDIVNEPSENLVSVGRSSLTKIEGAVELEQVTFRYTEDGKEALRRVDLRISPGETVGITGLSGSGKSTITKLIQRLYVPQSGRVFIDGIDLAMANPALIRKNMGVVLQENFLFNGSIRDNIVLGNPLADDDSVARAAELSGAAEFINESPHQYDTPVGERGANLSGGQRQRLAIARALASDPSILIFDEATSALDYESEAHIIDRLPDILRGRTAIMIAHRLNTIRLCDRIVVMENGEILEQGTHDALLELGGRYAQLWKMQNG